MDTEAPLDCRREHGIEALSALLGHRLPSPYVHHENDHNLKVVPSLAAVVEPNAAATTRLWPVEVALMAVVVREKQDVLLAAL